MTLDTLINKNSITLIGNDKTILLKSENPVKLELWNGIQNNDPIMIEAAYDYVDQKGEVTTCTANVESEDIGSIKLIDRYYKLNDDTIRFDRKLSVIKQGHMKGIRLWYSSEIFPADKPDFGDLRYFAPPAIFDKNDLDEDGVEDYFHTKNLMYREDRINFPNFLCYSENRKKAVCMGRAVLPSYDSNPERKEKETVFLQKTDIGSLGVWNDTKNQVELRAAYPFYEGEGTIGLYISKTVPFGAFWPLESGEEMIVSYFFSTADYETYNEACWESIRRIIKENEIKPVELSASPDLLVKYRLESLERYYIEKDASEDANCPAGYVLNCHPQIGEQLENIIQYGFTGQNILNAYNILRYGYTHNKSTYIEHARKITDFFANKIQIKESGIFYNLYNIDMKKVNFWWTGLLLPVAYAQGDELQRLMGPLYDHKKDLIDELSTLEGAYLRCMNEDATALLRIYRYEFAKGNKHENWITAVKNYCEFLLRAQEEDGSWYRAYDTTGKPIINPEIWFGATIYEKKSSTGTSIPLLVEMYELTGDGRYLKCAEKAGMFVKEYIIDRVRFNGGVHDSIYSKGQLIDNESILYPMFGMLSLYHATKKQIFLEGAIDAAHFYASWVCLWDVPLPEDSTLAKYNFRSTGIGACDTCGAGYTHSFQLIGVAELAEIAILAKDKELFETARLYWHGCNQTVSMPQNDWGLKYYGLQEEGWLVSWFAVDDPMFASDTGFGNRLKGEGNKTCFPWIQACAVKGYWTLLDKFGTTDFDDIYEKNFN